MSTSFFLTSVCRADELSDFWFMLSAGRTSRLSFSLCFQPSGQDSQLSVCFIALIDREKNLGSNLAMFFILLRRPDTN